MISKLYEDVKLVFLYNCILIYFILKTFVFLPNLVVNVEDPYVSGDFFRSLASHVVYSEKQAKKLESVTTLENGSILFLQPEYLWAMEKFQRRNKNSYILITHDSDLAVPGTYFNILNDPNLIRWFGQNIDTDHVKLEGIPIGIANAHWVHGNQNRIVAAQSKMMKFNDRFPGIFIGFMAPTDKTREPLREHFCSENVNWTFCMNRRTTVSEHLNRMGTVQFVLSPRGNGVDCHRTWEAIAMGAIPVVESGSLDSMLISENVLIVSSFQNVTQIMLQEAARNFSLFPKSGEKLYRRYWTYKISRYQNNI